MTNELFSGRGGVLESLARELTAKEAVENKEAVRYLADNYARFFYDFAYRYSHEQGHIEAFIDTVKRYQTIPDHHPTSIAVHGQAQEILKLLEVASDSRAGPEQVMALMESMLGFLYHSIRITLPGTALSAEEGANAKRDAKVSNTNRANVNIRHNQPGGYKERKDRLIEIWKSGKYDSKDRCAEEECGGLDMAFATARKALKNQ